MLCVSGGQALGPVQKQTQDELREAEPRPALLLPQEHHPQNRGQALRLPLCLRRARHAGKDGQGGAGQLERHPTERAFTQPGLGSTVSQTGEEL